MMMMMNGPRRKEKERVCMCVRSRFRDHGGTLGLDSDSGKMNKSHWWVGGCVCVCVPPEERKGPR